VITKGEVSTTMVVSTTFLAQWGFQVFFTSRPLPATHSKSVLYFPTTSKSFVMDKKGEFAISRYLTLLVTGGRIPSHLSLANHTQSRFESDKSKSFTTNKK